MRLYSTKVMLEHARENGYAVPAFNITDMQSIIAVVEACEEENAPCLLQAGEKTTDLYGADYIAAIVKIAAERASVPVALHLDHGYRLDSIMMAIRHGFSSVMIDASKYELEENIRITKHIVDLAHACDVYVEAELGHVGQGVDTSDEIKSRYTDPSQAKLFVEETGVDFLAVAVGTAHGVYKHEPELQLELLEEIGNLVSIPLVLHGASGTPGLTDTLPLGISKVNLFTDLQKPIIDTALNIIETTERSKLKATVIWDPANKAVKTVVKEKLRLLGTSNRIQGGIYK